MQKLRCHCCGKELPAGTLKYVLEVKSFADFDGYLEDYEGDIEEGINYLLETIDGLDEKSLEAEVSREMAYILCKSCCDRFMNDPFQTGKTPLKMDDVKGTVH